MNQDGTVQIQTYIDTKLAFSQGVSPVPVPNPRKLNLHALSKWIQGRARNLTWSRLGFNLSLAGDKGAKRAKLSTSKQKYFALCSAKFERGLFVGGGSTGDTTGSHHWCHRVLAMAHKRACSNPMPFFSRLHKMLCA